MTPEGINFLICIGILAIFWFGVATALLIDEKGIGVFLAFVAGLCHVIAVIFLIKQLAEAFTA